MSMFDSFLCDVVVMKHTLSIYFTGNLLHGFISAVRLWYG